MTTSTTDSAGSSRLRHRPQPRPPTGEAQTRYRLLSIEDVLTFTGWSIDTLNRRLASSDFPQPVEGKKGMARKWTLAQYETWAKRKQDLADKVA